MYCTFYLLSGLKSEVTNEKDTILDTQQMLHILDALTMTLLSDRGL
jgi:hypothetical protein